MDHKLLYRTMSAFPLIRLTDIELLLAVRGADVFLDPIVRFMEGDESSNSDNDRNLATSVFALLRAGARSITFAHHSPKSFERDQYMALENVLRGAGDIGAMLATAFGVRQLKHDQNIVQVEHIKARDFGPVPPFQIIGKPHIDRGMGYQIHRKPEECGYLKESLQECGHVKRTGRPKSEERALRIQRIRDYLELNPNLSLEQVITQLRKENFAFPPKYFEGTVKKELSEARKAEKF